MRTYKLVAISLVLALFGAGCSSGSSSSSAAAPAPSVLTYPTGVVPGSTTGTVIPVTTDTGSNSVPLSVVSMSELQNYAAIPLYSVSNVRLAVQMAADSRNLYYGGISISYDDAYTGHHASLQLASSGQNIWLAGGGSTNNLWADEYNYWRSSTTFSGFLQDQFGGVILVITGGTNSGSGDGVGGGGTLNGEIWYRNFNPATVPQGPDRECWFITNGPFQCGSSKVINGGLKPTDSYRLLGTFTGLSASAAFGN